MSSQDLNLALLLKLNNQMSSALKKAVSEMERDIKKVDKSVQSVDKSTTKTSSSMSQLGRTTASASSALTRLAAVSATIKTTPLRMLSREMRSFIGLANLAHKSIMKVVQTGGALATGGYVLKSAMNAPMSYDRQLALLANTSYADRDVTGRIAGKMQLDSGIRNAVAQGGGTPEQAMEGLNALVSSGVFGNASDAISLLPTLQKFATGTGAQASDLAQIMVAAKQTMGIGDKEMPLMLSKAIRAGQAGGFELFDMAKWLPQQMALAATNGMKGMSGFESLLAANQVSRITAGTSDEAGNNLVNLLAKINSQDTAKDFAKQGINLPSTLASARGRGVNALEAFVDLVERIGTKDANYMALRKKASVESGAQRKSTLNAMADIMQQKSIGKAIQDRQALMELLALIQQRSKYDSVKNIAHLESGSEGEKSFGTVKASIDYKAEQLGNKKAYAAIDTLAAIEGPLSKFLDKTNELATKYSSLATATYAATTALAALAAAAGAGGLLSMLSGRAAGGVSGGAAMGAASRVLNAPLLALSAAAASGDLLGHAFYSFSSEDTQEMIGGVVAQALANFGNKQAERALEINLNLDGRQIARAVNKHNSAEARRY